jgi:hypothetical protein
VEALKVQVLSCLPSVIVAMKKNQRGNRKLDIREVKLGRHAAWGRFHHTSKKIEIDPRQLSKHYLYVLIHELMHMAFPELTEDGVIRAAKLVAKGVWQQGFRRLKE